MFRLHFCSYNRHHACRLVKAYAEGVVGRVLPLFDNIDAEADAAANEYFNVAMARPGYDDPGDIADDAFEHGLEQYETLDFVRQQLLGLAIAGAYHLWERLTKEFLLRELQRQTDERASFKARLARADFKRLVGLLAQMGWSVEVEPFYPELDRLRLIANSVKHGDGDSTSKLLAAAPDLFMDFGGLLLNEDRGAEHLRLTREHFEAAIASITAFFGSFPEELTKEGSLSLD